MLVSAVERALVYLGAAACGLGCGGDPAAPSIESRRLYSSASADAVTVSLTFDDSWKEQLEAAAILEAHGLFGTFYVNSPRLHEGSARPDASASMSIADARSLQARGHELGGHTLGHLALGTLPEVEREREISADRRQLLQLGLEARSFAYPNGDVEAALGRPLQEVARDAGYASARDTNGVGLDDCGAGPESLPPADPYRLRSVRSVNDVPPVADGQLPPPPDDAATLLGWIDHAARCGGGWLPLIFHHVRPDCGEPGASPGYCFDLPELEVLASALATGTRCLTSGGGDLCYGVSVATVSAALGDAALPAAPEVLATRNASLERTLASGASECIQHAQSTQGTARFGRSTQQFRSGQASEQVEIAEPYVAPAEIRISRDFGACSLFVSEASAYELSLHYRAEASGATLRFVVYRLAGDYTWQAWSTGQPFPATSPGLWVRQSLTTEAVPAGTIALSFGLRLESVGSVAIDDLGVAPAPPASLLAP